MTDNKAEESISLETQNQSVDVTTSVLNCSVCNINLQDKEELHQHLVGKKHKKTYRILEEQQRINKQCGLYIKGFHHTIRLEELLSHFQSFGTVVWVHMGIGFLLLDYEDPESANHVLKKSHFIKERRLFIKRREYKEPRVRKVEDDDGLLGRLKEVDDIHLQIKIFKAYFEVDFRSNYENYNKVNLDLLSSLSEYFPNCRINPFGSTVTGLCFKNSDLDVYISGINRGNDTVSYLYSIRDILNRSRKFVNVLVIAHAKIPIIKCLHRETQINCDINLKNMLGVCNSNLIKYYINIDQKIKNMLVVLKYWARVHKITGQNHLFTNYALSLMVIFFLQQKPYSLPPVLSLQKADRYHYSEGYWTGSFKEVNLYRTTVETLRRKTFIEMLTEFFDFYSKFDYEKKVICPYLGKIVEKESFKSPESLANCYSMYKEYLKVEGNLPLKIESTICLQDPFEHSRNTTSVILTTVLNNFINFCKLGFRICSAGTNKLLYKLFTEDLQVEKKISQVTSSNDTQKFRIKMWENVKCLQKKIHESDETLDRVTAEKVAWFETVKEFMKIVLGDFLDFEIEEHQSVEAVPAKNKKENNQTNVHDNKSVHWKCSAKFNFWDCRKSKLDSLQNDEFKKKQFIEKEVAITQAIKTDFNFIPIAKILEFDFFINCDFETPCVDITIKKISCYKNIFKGFSTFFIPKVMLWLTQYEQMLTLEMNNAKSS